MGATDELWNEPLMGLLRDLPPSGGLSAARCGSRLKSIFDRVKEEIADAVAAEFDQDDEAMDESKLKAILEARTNARLKETQADVFRVMMELAPRCADGCVRDNRRGARLSGGARSIGGPSARPYTKFRAKGGACDR